MLSVLGVAVLAVVLSGCVRFDVALSVSDQDDVNGLLVVAADRGLLGLGDQELSDLLDTLQAAVPTHLDGVTSHPYDVEGYVGRSYVFDQVPLAAFNAGMAMDPEAWMRVERRGERFELTGVVDLTAAAVDDPGDASRFASSADVEVRLSFPGRVATSNGEVDGRTVTWVAPVGEATTLSATASASSRPTLQDLLGWPLVATAGLVFLLVLWWMVRRFDAAVDAERMARRAPAPGFLTPDPHVPATWSAAHLPSSDHPSYDLPDQQVRPGTGRRGGSSRPADLPPPPSGPHTGRTSGSDRAAGGT